MNITYKMINYVLNEMFNLVVALPHVQQRISDCQQSAQVLFHPSLPVYLLQGCERTTWPRSVSFIKNGPRSSPTGGNEFIA